MQGTYDSGEVTASLHSANSYYTVHADDRVCVHCMAHLDDRGPLLARRIQKVQLTGEPPSLCRDGRPALRILHCQLARLELLWYAHSAAERLEYPAAEGANPCIA